MPFNSNFERKTRKDKTNEPYNLQKNSRGGVNSLKLGVKSEEVSVGGGSSSWRLRSLFSFILSVALLFGVSSAWAADVYWTGAVNNYWNESGNWTGQHSLRPLPTNDVAIFDNTGTYMDNEVVLTEACTNNWRTFIRGVGTVETPLVFRATGPDYGLRFGNQNWNNPSCIGDSGDAYLCLKSGTWSATYLKLDNTAQLTLTDGALLSVDNDTILEKGNCKVSVTGGARFYTAAYFAHKAGEVKVENGTLEVGTSQNYEFGEKAAATLLLNEGGLLILRRVQKKTNGGTVLFNGGTLRSNGADNTLVDGNITVTVGALGGTIDNGGSSIAIASPLGGSGGLTFIGSGTTTLTGANTYTGETEIGVRTKLVVTSTELARLFENGGIKVVKPEGVSAKGTFKLLGKSDGSCTAAEYALITKGAGLEDATFGIDEDGDITVTVSHTPQTWAGAAETSALWSGDNWDAGVAFDDGNDAVFVTDGAIAEVDDDISAYTLTFNDNAMLTGTGMLTAPTITVAEGKVASIAGPLAGPMEKTGAGTLTLCSSREGTTTTLTEGTLVANAPVGTLVLGTDATKPVTFDYGGQTYATALADIDNDLNVSLANGIFKIQKVVKGALTVATDTTITRSGDIVVGQSTGTGTLTMNGGAVSCSKTTYIADTSGGTGVVMVNDGNLTSPNDFYVGNRGTGTLTINGGTVEVGSSTVQKWVRLGKESGSTGIVNLNGGELKLWHVRKDNGTGSLVFNGGTLVANGVSSSGLIYSNLPVTVNAGDGTIDANGNNVMIRATTMSGVGGMTYQGGGKVTFEVQPTYTGVTMVEVGTTLVVPAAIAGDKLAFVVPGDLADGVYDVVALSGDGVFADDVLEIASKPVGDKIAFRLRADKKAIVCVYGTYEDPLWIGGNGDMALAANWSTGTLPTGNAVISSSSALTLTNSGSFSPSTITIPDSSAIVTLAGALTVNCLTNASKLAVAATGSLTVTSDLVGYAGANENKPLLYSNYGTVTVGGKVRFRDCGTSKNQCTVSQYAVADENSMPIIANGLAYHADKDAGGSWYKGFLVANLGSMSDGPGKWVVGENGFTFPDSRNIDDSGFRVTGSQKVTLYSSADWTLDESYRRKGNDLYIRNTATVMIDTTDYNDHTTGRTVTLKGYINAQGSAETPLTITGNGTVVLDSKTANNHTNVVTGAIAVADGATLQINKDVVVGGTGSISLAAGTTLALSANDDKTFSVRDIVPVTLPDSGTATLQIDGPQLRSGDYVLFNSVPAGYADHLTVTGTAIDGRRTVLKDDGTSLILTIVPTGLTVIIH